MLTLQGGSATASGAPNGMDEELVSFFVDGVVQMLARLREQCSAHSHALDARVYDADCQRRDQCTSNCGFELFAKKLTGSWAVFAPPSIDCLDP